MKFYGSKSRSANLRHLHGEKELTKYSGVTDIEFSFAEKHKGEMVEIGHRESIDLA